MAIPEALYVLAKGINELGGHTTEGIFRIPGGTIQNLTLLTLIGELHIVNQVRNEMNHQNYKCDLSSCHNAATLFKLFLRELQEPVIPNEHYTNALRLGIEKNAEGILALIRKFPQAHQELLWWVVSYLQTFLVDKTIEATKMDRKNLALVLSASIMRCPDADPLTQINATGAQAEFTYFLLGLTRDGLAKVGP